MSQNSSQYLDQPLAYKVKIVSSNMATETTMVKIFSGRLCPKKIFTMVASVAMSDEKIFTMVFSASRKHHGEYFLWTLACRKSIHHGVFVSTKTPW